MELGKWKKNLGVGPIGLHPRIQLKLTSAIHPAVWGWEFVTGEPVKCFRASFAALHPSLKLSEDLLSLVSKTDLANRLCSRLL